MKIYFLNEKYDNGCFYEDNHSYDQVIGVFDSHQAAEEALTNLIDKCKSEDYAYFKCVSGKTNDELRSDKELEDKITMDLHEDEGAISGVLLIYGNDQNVRYDEYEQSQYYITDGQMNKLFW